MTASAFRESKSTSSSRSVSLSHSPIVNQINSPINHISKSQSPPQRTTSIVSPLPHHYGANQYHKEKGFVGTVAVSSFGASTSTTPLPAPLVSAYKVYPHRSDYSPPLQKSPSAEMDNKPTKKRKANIRACDACAIRKTRCEENRPCSHCVHNNLECTQLRERKKSGPKKLRKKTMESIQNIKESANSSEERLSLSKNPSANTVPIVQSVSAPAQTNTESEPAPRSLSTSHLVTPTVLIEILILANHPILTRVLHGLTLTSFLDNIPQLINFIDTSFQHKISDIAELNSDDPVFLSKLSAILTLCLLIIENIIKFNYFNYQNFQIFNNDIFKLKNFVLFLQNKIVDTLTLLNKILLFPTTANSLNLESTHHFQINYNQSISSLHLYNYYQITSSLNNNQRYKDQQRLIHLRKAITFYQLIEIPHKSDLKLIQLYELYECLFVLERFNHLLDKNLFIKHNNLILNIWNSSMVSIQNGKQQNIQTDMFKLWNSCEDLEILHPLSAQTLAKFSELSIKSLCNPRNGVSAKFLKTKHAIRLHMEQNYDKLRVEEALVVVSGNILLFKTLLIDSSDFDKDSLISELRDIMIDLNQLFRPLLQITGDESVEPEKIKTQNKDEAILLKMLLSNYQVLPHLLQILKIDLELCEGDPNVTKDDVVVTFSNYLTQFFITYADSNNLIKSDLILNEWFVTLNKINFENQLFLNNLLNNLENSVNLGQKLPQQSLPDFNGDITVSQPKETKAEQKPVPKNDHKRVMMEEDDDDEDDEDDDEGYLSLPSKSKRPPPLVSSSSSYNSSSSKIVPVPSSIRKVPSVRQMLPPLTPVLNSSGSFLGKPSVSSTSLLPFANTDLVTGAPKEEEATTSALSLSESTKNLYNLFNQITDDLTTTSNNTSLTNLFQFNSLAGQSTTNLAYINSNLSQIASSSQIAHANNNSSGDLQQAHNNSGKPDQPNNFLL